MRTSVTDNSNPNEQVVVSNVRDPHDVRVQYLVTAGIVSVDPCPPHTN